MVGETVGGIESDVGQRDVSRRVKRVREVVNLAQRRKPKKASKNMDLSVLSM